MTIEFKLQEVSEGVESVDIAEIMVSAGDVIDAGAIVCEVETDKAVAEIECPHAGTVKEILVTEGESVAIGASLLVIEEVSMVAAASYNMLDFRSMYGRSRTHHGTEATYKKPPTISAGSLL